MHLDRHALCQQHRLKLMGKGAGALFKARIVAALQKPQRGQACSHCQGIARERPGLVDLALGSDVLHNLSPAAKGSHRKAAADNLAKRGQIRRNTVSFLGSAVGQAESGDDLVKNQQGAVFCGQLPESLQKSFCRLHQAHVGSHGLHDNAGYLVAMLLKKGAHGLKVVVGGKQRVGHNGLRHAGRAGNGERGNAGSRSSQEGIGMAVVASYELDQLVPVRIAAGQAQGAHGRLSA